MQNRAGSLLIPDRTGPVIVKKTSPAQGARQVFVHLDRRGVEPMFGKHQGEPPALFHPGVEASQRFFQHPAAVIAAMSLAESFADGHRVARFSVGGLNIQQPHQPAF